MQNLKRPIFTPQEREQFQEAIKELIKQVDECVARNKLTKRGKISSKHTRSEKIKENLSFLERYGYAFRIGIGNGGGFLSEKSYIVFARKDILMSDKVNSKELKLKNGIYIYCFYRGYLNNQKKYLHLDFNFPKGDIENSRCLAVNQMEKDGVFEEYIYQYPDLEDLEKMTDDFDFIEYLISSGHLEKMTDDFIEMIHCFNQYDATGFNRNSYLAQNDSKEAIEENQQWTDPLNQILYGPPGTGKTYNTINKALEIIAKSEKITYDPKDRENAKKLFNEFIEKGQIAFVTFHQSYGYEEFVEGIKPDGSGGEIRYEIKSGIFKDIAKKAEQNYLDSLKTEKTLQEEKKHQR